jgi:8-oxo-dGTP pyrophosphatase MutT (NUDIX family)
LREVKGGTHIAPEVICTQRGEFLMAVWPTGLPRHDTTRAVRFPHGLIIYSETFEDCAARLVREQLGMSVVSVRTLKIYSYMDDSPHWHIEPLLHAEVDGAGPAPPDGVEEVVRFFARTLPPDASWSEGEFEKVFDEFFK